MMGERLLLGIESSCDETAAAVVTDRLHVRSNVVWSQIDLHQQFGGVVPEVASRAHLDAIDLVIPQALREADIEPADLTGIAVTRGPGLQGALLVGVAAAKALGFAWDLPVVGVNHLTGHLNSCFLDRDDEPAFPAVVLLVSGGHCLLATVESRGRYEIIGQTVDDSVGEAYDKFARFLGLGYPGGPVVDRLAGEGRVIVKLPRPMLASGFEFSFAGLKTAATRFAEAHPDASVPDLCASFADACMDVLVTKATRALDEVGARTLMVVGGVAASPPLRDRMATACADRGVELFIPRQAYATDNAAMIAAAGWHQLGELGPSDPHFGAEPSLRFGQV